ncbi:MAG: hypothetical protein ACHQ4G_10855, partial [Opitutales bacterium]
TLTANAGLIEKGALIGRFDDLDLRTRLETTQLRLQIARQQETDFLADLPKHRHEAEVAVSDLEHRLAILNALQKDPKILADLPGDLQASLQDADIKVVQAQLEAARAQARRLDEPDYAKASPARLAVLEAEQAGRELETQLRDAQVAAPAGGQLQPAANLVVGIPTLVTIGQEIGTLRDTRRIVAVIPALSPYLIRSDLHRTILRIEGPGGKVYTAQFRESTTESTPLSTEARVCWYEFAPEDTPALAGMILSNAYATVWLIPEHPVAVVNKLQAALAHPGAFGDGWAKGAAAVWPGWKVAGEGETDLGLVKP